ncbi:MAG TPA: V-type ATPase subunit, partial [Thermosynergistes sp.]|nr:V-type ATPase subunit [Thermosynergistes sp.]
MSFSPLSAGECTTVGAKARVLYGRLLSDMDYWEILQCDTVPEIADYLQRAEGYREDMSTLIAANAH